MARVDLYDTTLRDGSQGEGISFSVQDKLAIVRRLDDLGIDFIEGGYPLSNPKDAEFFASLASLSLRHARVAAFGMTRRKGIDAASDPGLKALLDAGTALVTLVGKTWDLHVLEVISTTLAENLAMIADSVAYCRTRGREVFYDAEHFFDGHHANPEYALATLQAAAGSGATTVILCDTNGGSLPTAIALGVKAAIEACPGVTIGIHCHNDCELAVANSLAGVEAGARQVQGTINGIGERCGNADLISLAAVIGLKSGHEVLLPTSLARLTEVSRFVYETANMNFRPGQPFVGSSAFAHKGGMHTHAVSKLARSYEHIDPGTVGNERRILVSELSGQSTIITKTARLSLAHDKELMRKILERVQDLEHAGYEFEAAEASFEILVRKVAGTHRSLFDLVSYRVNVEHGPEKSGISEATVKLCSDGSVIHTVAEGDGPVNALDAALRKALVSVYPRLAEMTLVDYKVRVVNGREGTAARVRVVLESKDKTSLWSTVGVSENIIEASWLALVDSIDYKVIKDGESPD
ncbi:MAG: citramalate synthase [Planctomycetota bacterium]|nr:citramalate synthase [Planctomycetota bacterium]RLS38988.1 MAG: citramalate synthase [Planctomycetota bacterium]